LPLLVRIENTIEAENDKIITSHELIDMRLNAKEIFVDLNEKFSTPDCLRSITTVIHRICG
jgi:hypothetical protein